MRSLIVCVMLCWVGCSSASDQPVTTTQQDTPEQKYAVSFQQWRQEANAVADLAELNPSVENMRSRVNSLKDLYTRLPNPPSKYAEFHKDAKNILSHFDWVLEQLVKRDQAKRDIAMNKVALPPQQYEGAAKVIAKQIKFELEHFFNSEIGDDKALKLTTSRSGNAP